MNPETHAVQDHPMHVAISAVKHVSRSAVIAVTGSIFLEQVAGRVVDTAEAIGRTCFIQLGSVVVYDIEN
jgi:hypothetical protein